MTEYVEGGINADQARYIGEALNHLNDVQASLRKIESGLNFPVSVWSELVGVDGVFDFDYARDEIVYVSNR